MTIKKILISVSLLVLSVTISGCLQVNTGQNKKEIIPDGGFFISQDKGTTWQQRTAILSTSGEKKNFSLSSVATITVDPSDPSTIYFGTSNQGMVYTYDQGLSWQLATNLGPGPGMVQSIAVDPRNTCTIYATVGNKIFKTTNCSRSWEAIFTESTSRVKVMTVAVDHFDSNNIYATLSRGDVIKSTNGGESWRTLYRFNNKIEKFYMDPSDSRRIYVFVDKKGLYQSNDSAQNFEDINDIFSEFKIKKAVTDIKLFKSHPNLIFIATEQGIIKSTDRGATWKRLLLLPPEKKAFIASMAVNSENINEIYYVTGSTFYKTIDGGENWSPRSLPSTKKAKVLLLDWKDSNILYLGLASQ